MHYWSPLLGKVLVCLIFDNLNEKTLPVHIYYLLNKPFLANLFTESMLQTLTLNSHTTTWASFNSRMSFYCKPNESVSSKCYMKK